jgi:2-iminobutanoate/2-iminopropanoate deaminase
MDKIETSDAPKAIGPYSQAIRAGDFLFVSGQIPIDPRTGKIDATTIEAQTAQVLHNIEAILRAAHCDWSHVVKTEIYLQDLQDFQVVNMLYAEKFVGNVHPARQTVQVAKLPMNARLEISCIAMVE